MWFATATAPDDIKKGPIRTKWCWRKTVTVAAFHSKAEAPKPAKSCEWNISHELLACSYCYQAEQNGFVLSTPQSFPYSQPSLDRIQLMESPQTSHCCLKMLFVKRSPCLETTKAWKKEIWAGTAFASEGDRNQYCPVQFKVKTQLDHPQGFKPSFKVLFMIQLQSPTNRKYLPSFLGSGNQWQNWDSKGWFSITPYKAINRCDFSQLTHIC